MMPLRVAQNEQVTDEQDRSLALVDGGAAVVDSGGGGGAARRPHAKPPLPKCDYRMPLKSAPEPPASSGPKRRVGYYRRSSSDRTGVKSTKTTSASAAAAAREDSGGNDANGAGGVVDRREAWAAAAAASSGNNSNKPPSDRSLSLHSRSPSFDKIDLDDSPLNDDISVGTLGTAFSALTFGTIEGGASGSSSSTTTTTEEEDIRGNGNGGGGGGNGSSNKSYVDSTDLAGYVRSLRRDMARAREDASTMQEAAEATTEACGSSEGKKAAAAVVGAAAAGLDGEDEAEVYKGMVGVLQAELAEMTKKLEESREELERRKQHANDSAVPPLGGGEISVPDDADRPASGPWKKLARRIGGGTKKSRSKSSARMTTSSSACSVMSSSSFASSALSLGTTFTAPAHLEISPEELLLPEEEDPRASEVRSLRERLEQCEFQNQLRGQSIQSLTFTRDTLERELDEERNEQCRLTMEEPELKDRQTKEQARLRTYMDVELAWDVAKLRKKIERDHRAAERLKVKVSLASSDFSSSSSSGDDSRPPPGLTSSSARKCRSDRNLGASRNDKSSTRKDRHHRSNDKKPETRASFGDVGHLLLLTRSSESDQYRRQAAHNERKRRLEGRASFADHLHGTNHAPRPRTASVSSVCSSSPSRQMVRSMSSVSVPHRRQQQRDQHLGQRRQQRHSVQEHRSSGRAQDEEEEEVESWVPFPSRQHTDSPQDENTAAGLAPQRKQRQQQQHPQPQRRRQRASLADIGSILSKRGGGLFGGGGGGGNGNGSVSVSAPASRSASVVFAGAPPAPNKDAAAAATATGGSRRSSGLGRFLGLGGGGGDDGGGAAGNRNGGGGS